MDIFLLYLWTRLPSTGFPSALGVVMAAIAIALYICGHIEKSNVAKSIAKLCTVFSIVCFVIGIFVPTQKEAALILAGSAIIEISKSDQAKRLAGKSVQLIEQTLDAYLNSPKK